MKIRKLTATFGKLQNASLTFGDGLNVLYGPNESGKSTWVSFIHAMLYGIDTSEKEKKDYLPDKKKYLPWSGQPMAGKMELSFQDRLITIERFTTRGGAPMQDFRAYETTTGAEAAFLNPAGAGRTLCGVGQEAYIRSGYIGKSGLPVGESGELERRIQALFSSGEENSSYSEAKARLSGWINQKSRARTGELSRAAEELAALDKTLQELSGLAAQETRLHAGLMELENRRSQLSETLQLHLAYETNWKRTQARRAREQYEELGALADTLEAGLARDGMLPDSAFFGSLRIELARLDMLSDQLGDAKAQAEQCRSLAREADDALAGCPAVFSSLSYEQAQKRAQEDARRAAALEAEAIKHRGIIPYFLPAAALLLLAAALAILAPAAIPYEIAGFALSACAGALVLRRARSAQAAARAQLDEILSLYACPSAEQILQVFSEYSQRAVLASSRAQTREEAEKKEKALLSQVLEMRQRIQSLSRPFFHPNCGADQIKTGLPAMEAELERLQNARRDRDIARSRYTLLADSGNDGDSEALPPAPPEKPEGEKHSLEADLAAVADRISLAQRELAAVRGQMKHFGDPAALAARREQMKNRMEALRTEADALQLAMECLENAEAEIQRQFSPPLSKRTAEILAAFTGGRYDKVLVDHHFSPTVTETGQFLTRRTLELSRGTADQLYLALRLAVYELIMPPDNPPPMVLDDALLTFDRERLRRALDWLRSQAQNRQILLFSCRPDEAEYLDGQADVRILRLP